MASKKKSAKVACVEDNHCEDCRYMYQVPDGSTRVVCVRNPPIPVYDPQAAATDQYVKAAWPVVQMHWFCGEFKPKGAA